VRRPIPLAILVVLAAVVAADAAVSLNRSTGTRRPTPPALGVAFDRALPPLPLIDEQGRGTSLGAFKGRWLVLAPSLTLCHEVCPLTTAALEQVQAAVRARGLSGRVAVAEASVDPWRDSPARLRAFKRMTGTSLPLLTGTRAQLRRLWRTLGVAFTRTRGDGKDRDWWTGRRLRFDVSHTDGVFIIDPRGHLRVFASGMPGVGRLPRRLRALLNAEGRNNLTHPEAPWNVSDLLDDLWGLMGVRAAPAAAPPAAAATPQPGAGQLVPGGAGALRARLAALHGRPAVVNAWASWCPPCREEFPFFAAAAKRSGGDVAFLGLDVSDQAAKARAFLADHRVPYPIYADDDGAAARALSGLQGLPTTVFFDRRGRIDYVHTGGYRSLTALEDDVAAHAK
jgi:cytochrome oxidase Cu insertion factor (SCO1/SenC/PrrC family)/thiol-disulfide isomerase/thioredoxin